MKKTAFYLFILFALVFGVFYLFIYDKKPTEAQERDFAVPNFDELGKIEIKDRKGQSITLENIDGKWKLNGKYAVKSSMFNELKKTVTNMEAVSVVAEVAKDNVLKEMISRSNKVSFYKKGKKKAFKTYIVGGATHQQDGTHVLMEINGKAASTPYIAKVPGRRGYFTYNFTPIESEWRSLQFTKLLPQEINEVRVSYTDETLQNASYSIKRDKGDFSLTTHEGTFDNEAINPVSAQNLFKAFSNLHYESYQDDYAKKDSVMQHLAFGRIDISTSFGTKESLQLFKMPLREGDRKKIIDGKENEFNIEKLYAFNEANAIFATIQFYTFEDILISGADLKK